MVRHADAFDACLCSSIECNSALRLRLASDPVTTAKAEELLNAVLLLIDSPLNTICYLAADAVSRTKPKARSANQTHS